MSSADRPDQSITLTLIGHDAVAHLITQVLQSDDKRLSEVKAAMSGELRAAMGGIGATKLELQDALTTLNGRLDRIEVAISQLHQRNAQAPGAQNGFDDESGEQGVRAAPATGRPRSWASVFSFGLL